MGDGVTVRSICSEAALAPFDRDYRTLLARVPHGRGLFYQRPWLQAMAPVYLAGRRTMLFLLAFRGDTLIGVAPWCIERKPLTRFGLRRLTFWGADGGSLMLEGNVLVPDPADINHCMHAWRTHLFQEHRWQFDVIDFGYCREDTLGWQALKDSSPRAAVSSEILKTHLVDLPARFSDYCATRSRSGLSQLRRQERVLAQAHAVEWCVRTRLSADEFEQVGALHAQRQRELATRRSVDRHAFFEDPQGRDAMSRVLRVAGEAGEARHYLLKVDGRVAAFNLNFVFAGTQFFHSTAIDSTYAMASPGKLVLLRQIEHECTLGEVSTIDMMAGTTPLKASFCTRTLAFGHLTEVNPMSTISMLKYGAYRQLLKLKHH